MDTSRFRYKLPLVVMVILLFISLLSSVALSKKTLTVAAFGSPKQNQQWARIFSIFEKEHPNIKVSATYTAGVEFDRLILQLASGKAPDVVLLWGWYVAQLAPRNLLRPIDPVTLQEAGKKMFPKMNQLCSWKGKVVALPWMVGTSGIFYNESFFSEAGVPPLSESYDMNSFRLAAVKMTKDRNGDGKPDQWGFLWYRYLVREWMNWVWRNGGDIFDANKKQFLFNQPAAVEALQWLADLSNVYKGSAPATHADAVSPWIPFYAGKSAMYPAGAWDAYLLHDTKLKIKCGPYPKARRDITAVESFTASVTAGSKRPKEATDLVKFLTMDSKAQTLITEAGWGSPVLPEVADNTFVTKGNPYREDYFLRELKSGDFKVLPYTTSLWTQIETVIRDGYEPMWKGQISALAAANAVKPNVEKLLARVK